MWWVQGAREIVAKHHAMKYGEGVTVAEADKEIRSKREQVVERQTKIAELEAQGLTQKEQAAAVGVSDRTIRRDKKADRNAVITEKMSAPRKWIQYTIRNTTKPETAASRIREVFGDDFADELREAVMDVRGNVRPICRIPQHHAAVGLIWTSGLAYSDDGNHPRTGSGAVYASRLGPRSGQQAGHQPTIAHFLHLPDRHTDGRCRHHRQTQGRLSGCQGRFAERSRLV